MQTSTRSTTWAQSGTGRLIMIAALTGVFLLVYWLAMKSRQALPEPSPLVVDDKYLSWGEVWEQQQETRTIPIVNRSGKEVRVRNFFSSCSCLSVEPHTLCIPPGETVNVRLIVNLRQALGGAGSAGVQPLCVKVVPVLDNQAKPEPGWIFCGKVRRYASFNPASMEVWAGLHQGRADLHRSVRVQLYVPAKKLIATSSSPFLSTTLTRQSSSNYQLDLHFSAQAPVGPFRHTVQLHITGEDGRETPASTLDVKGVVKEGMEVFPGQVSFGVARLGTRLSEDICLKPGAKEGISYLGMDNPCPDATLQHTGSDQEGFSFRLLQRIRRAGQQNYVLRFRFQSARPTRRLLVVPVRVSYYGFPTITESDR